MVTSPDETWEARLSSTLDQLQRAEAAITAATAERQRVSEDLMSLIGAARDDRSVVDYGTFRKLLRHIYWERTFVHASDLATAAGFYSSRELTRAVGPIASGKKCPGCGNDILRTSRSTAPKDLCEPCTKRTTGERTRLYRIDHLRNHLVETAAVGASALEWKVASMLVMAYPPVALGVEMNSDNDLRNGIWIPYRAAQMIEKRVRDLDADADAQIPVWIAVEAIPSAEDAAGWDIDRTRTLVDTVTEDAALAILGRLRVKVESVIEEQTARALNVYPDDYEHSETDPYPHELLSEQHHRWYDRGP